MFDFGIANERQKEAVTCTEGPLLIIAGPGTGKTFTLVKRIAYLVFEKGVKPSEIMAITFTEKAAHQLVTRISDEFLRYSGCENINIDEMYIGTFHSVCLRLMKEYSELLPFDADKRIIDSFEQQYLVYNNLERFRSVKGYCSSDFNSMSKWEQAKAICKYTSTMSEELLSRDKLLDDKDADILVIAKVWDEYDKLLTENNATDFSTIQADAWRMMQNSDISASVREKIRYVMVDEYQDTNHIQEQLILAIGEKHGNICVVGDDDQGLYRFRGATIRNIFEFPKHFGENECRVIKLEENYRSEKGIIDLYNNWMTNPEYKRKFDWGKYRYPKKIYTSKKETYSSVYTCKIIQADADTYISFRKLEEKGIALDDIHEFCNKVYATVNDGEYFTIHSIRSYGFTDIFENAGFGEYLCSALLACDSRFDSQSIFLSIVLSKNNEIGQISKKSFIKSCLSENVPCSPKKLIESVYNKYGVRITDKYEITEAIKNSNFCYDDIIDEIYAIE